MHNTYKSYEKQNPHKVAEIMKKRVVLAHFILQAVFFLTLFYYVKCIWKKINVTSEKSKRIYIQI